MIQAAIVNDEFLQRIQKSKVIVIDKRDNYFNEQGKSVHTGYKMLENTDLKLSVFQHFFILVSY